jgi:tetratricopeptide (TPR) repeat protein
MKNYQLALSALLLAGCATSGTPTKQATQTQRSPKVDLYLAGHSSAPVNTVSESCTPFKSASWKTLVGKASACAKSGQWTLVEEYAYEISKADMDSPWGLYFYSLAAEGKKDFPRAIWMIEAAIKKSGPNVALFRYQKGRLLWALKPTESALKEVELALKTDPSLVDGHVFLGDARMRSWELSTAENHFNTALQLKSNYYEAVRGMAECKRLKGDIKEAIPYLAQAMGMKPAELSTRVNLALAYEQEKQTSQALATYRALRESMNSGLVKDKPDFDVNEKIRSLENMVAAQDKKPEAQKLTRDPAQKGEKK